MECNVCTSKIHSPIYSSGLSASITSLCEVRNVRTEVYFCEKCGHLMSPKLEDLEAYYATDYRILLDHDDEDQIYDVKEGVIEYRTERQLSTLITKIELGDSAKILDYGCAKSVMTKRLKSLYPNLQCFLFDVSDMYVKYWGKLVSTSNWSINKTPDSWLNSFDLVTSYFSLEHIPRPILAIAHIHSLLKDNGTLYGIVPYVFSNPADFVVVDHDNHFTFDSLTYLLHSCGFCDVQIDSDSHRGALVFSAKKGGGKTSLLRTPDLRSKVEELAGFWTGLNNKISRLEAESTGPFAIYGSGFYGAYVYTNLKNKQLIQCFLDQSPFQQGKKVFGLNVLAPIDLPPEIRTLFVGLNPKIALDVIEALPELQNREIKVNFLA